MKVNIPFKERFRLPMTRGIKKWTSRTKRLGKQGDYFFAFGQKYVIGEVEVKTLGEVAEHFIEEGCESWSDFVDLWQSIHPRKGFNPFQKVYVHKFTMVIA